MHRDDKCCRQLQEPPHSLCEEVGYQLGVLVAEPPICVVEHDHGHKVPVSDDREHLDQSVGLVGERGVSLGLRLVPNLTGDIGTEPSACETRSTTAYPSRCGGRSRQVPLDLSSNGFSEPGKRLQQMVGQVGPQCRRSGPAQQPPGHTPAPPLPPWDPECGP